MDEDSVKDPRAGQGGPAQPELRELQTKPQTKQTELSGSGGWRWRAFDDPYVVRAQRLRAPCHFSALVLVPVFDWDPPKARSTLRRRNIGFEEAATVLDDWRQVTIE